MEKNPELTQKKFRATSRDVLKKFDPDCIAYADGGSQIFLLLGDASDEGLQSFIVARILTKDSDKLVEYLDTYEAKWRCSALRHFKKFLNALPGGYSDGGFLELPKTEVTPPSFTRSHFFMN